LLAIYDDTKAFRQKGTKSSWIVLSETGIAKALKAFFFKLFSENFFMDFFLLIEKIRKGGKNSRNILFGMILKNSRVF